MRKAFVNTRRGRVTTLDDRTIRGSVQCLGPTELAIETTTADDRGRIRRQRVSTGLLDGARWKPSPEWPRLAASSIGPMDRA